MPESSQPDRGPLFVPGAAPSDADLYLTTKFPYHPTFCSVVGFYIRVNPYGSINT